MSVFRFSGAVFFLLSFAGFVLPSALTGAPDDALTSAPNGAASASPPELSIYVYDSFAAAGGLGALIFPQFEKQCGCKLRVLPSGDGSQLLSRLALDQERGRSAAQIVVGLDGPTSQRALQYVEPFSGKNSEDLVRDTQGVLAPGFVAYDYGYFALIADQEQLKKLNIPAPTRFSDLVFPNWRRNLILEDPRTSTPGLSFVLYADELQADWSKLKSQWLTLAPGWDGAYGLFLKGQAPLVWSYTTSQAYHESHGDRAHRYQSVLFEEGQPIQVEGAALIKGSFSGPGGGEKHRLAVRFLEFLLSLRVQTLIPEHNWMYPARSHVKLPESFSHLAKPRRVIKLSSDPVRVKAALERWTTGIQ